MVSLNKKIGLSSILLLIIAISIATTPSAYSEINTEDKTLPFLSNVINLNLTKYNVKLEASSVNYASTFGPLVKEENFVYTLSSSESDMRVNFVFENGQLWYCDLSYIKGAPVYTSSPSTNVLDRAKGFIQKYQSYVTQTLAVDASYLQPMKSMLNDVSELKTMTTTTGKVKLEISTTVSEFYNVPLTNIKWIYTDSGVDIPRKSVALYFTNGTLRFFSDSWNLYTLGSPNVVSQDEAVSIAMAVAEKYMLKFNLENDTMIEIKPDLSNVTVDVSFAMVSLNSTILYPLWQVKLYFNKLYYNAYGIQVGIRGDTKEIAYCESLVTLGGAAQNPTTTTPQPTGDPATVSPEDGSSPTEHEPTTPPAETTPSPDNQTQQKGNPPPTFAYLLLAATATLVTVAATAVILKKRRSK